METEIKEILLSQFNDTNIDYERAAKLVCDIIRSNTPITLNDIKVGDRVHYKPAYSKREENGIVKEINTGDIGPDSVRVVYNCAGDWDNYQNYTSALTQITDLRLGWRE